MACKNTTSMYLNVNTEICASATASRSGNTVTVTGTFSVTQSSSYNINAIYAAVDQRTGWMRVKPYYQGIGTWTANFSFSFDDASANTKTFTAYFAVYNSSETASVGNWDNVSFSVSYPSAVTPPTDLSLSSISTGPDWVKGTVSVTSWGNTGDANTRYRNLSVCEVAASHAVRRYQRVYGNTLSSAITVDNNTQYGAMTIVPNTRYWLWWYATNGTANVESPTPSTTPVVTTAGVATVSGTATSYDTITISYSTITDGGYYDKEIQYSLDGTNWIVAATLTGGTATSGTYTITGLTADTTYTIRTRVLTTAGATNGATLSIKTNIAPVSFYGSVNGQSKKVTKLYGSVNGRTKQIKKLYGSVNGHTKLVYQA